MSVRILGESFEHVQKMCRNVLFSIAGIPTAYSIELFLKSLCMTSSPKMVRYSYLPQSKQ